MNRALSGMQQSTPVAYTCKHCGGSPTVKAHVIPRTFAHAARGSEKHLLSYTVSKIARSQSGLWDNTILCGKCDGKLGKIDQYGISTCRSLASRRFKRERLTFAQGVDGSRIALFINSVLWRASISQSQELAEFKLTEEQERKIEKAIFRQDGPSADEVFPVIAIRFITHELKPHQIFAYPWIHKIQGHVAANLILSGFRFTAILDDNPLSRVIKNRIVNNANPMPLDSVEFSETTEFKFLMDRLQTEN